MKIIKKIIASVLVSRFVLIFGAEIPQIPKSFNTRHDPRYLYNSVPHDLRDKVTYYRALVQQITPDQHSCGQRALFHALGFEYALENARKGIPLNTSLRSLFSKVKLCKSTIAKVNKTVLEENPFYDIKDGTYGYQLALAGNLKFSALEDKILPIYLKDYDELEIIHNGIPPTPTTLNADKFTSDNSRYYKSLSGSREFFLQMDKLRRPFDIIHFPALLDDQHWVLASVMLNYRYRRQLLIVDSCNRNLSNYPSLRTLIELLNEEMKKYDL